MARMNKKANVDRHAKRANDAQGTTQGFYSRHLRAEELDSLGPASSESLDGEIGLTRIAARRILQLLAEVESPEDKLDLLKAMTVASVRVGSLLKARRYLASTENDLVDAILSALSDLGAEEEKAKAHPPPLV